MNSDSMWLRRPTLDEDDDDVIRQRDEFLAAKHNPAAKCIRKSKEVDANKADSAKNDKSTDLPETSTPEVPVVLGQIVERDVVDFPNLMMMPVDMPQGFPVPSRRPKTLNPKKKTSIFLQQMEKLEKNSSAPSVKVTAPSKSRAETFHSSIIDGSGLGSEGQLEARKLHEENLQKIASLSREEIEQMRSQIVSNLGSDKIEFLCSRRKASKHDIKNRRPDSAASYCATRGQENLSGDPFEETIKESTDVDHDAIILGNLSAASDETPHQSDAAEASAPVQEVPVEELPINPDDAGCWLNMSQVERDKLAWMTLLPKLKPADKNATYTARFDFEGNLLPHEADIPTQMGLHHHSNEPEVAGYSVEELFLLARSSFQSQRITALETLAHILENHWNGRFDECFNPPLLSSLLEAGLAPLLRWALDDSTVSSVAAAVLCIHNLLVCKSDELCLDWTYCWRFGHFSPFLTAKVDEPDQNLDEMTDANIIKMDVISGFLRMDILPRFRYILRVLCPPSSVCKLIIEICIRIARHSPESAKQVFEFPGLMEAIFLKFLPVSWDYNPQKTNTSSFYCPMFSAVKLIRVISSAGKEFALHLLEKYDVKGFLMCYITIDPSDKKLPPVEVQKLMIESLKLWHILLSYGLCSDIYLDLFPVLMRQFTFCKSINLNANLEENIANYEYAAHFLKALQAVVLISIQPSEQSESNGKNGLTWLNVVELKKIGEVCLKRWLHEFSVGPTNFKGQVLLASCLNFITSFFSRTFLERENCVTQVSSELKSALGCYLQSCITSKEFNNLVSCMKSSSILLYKGSSGTVRDSNVLPSLGTILWQDDIVPLLREESPFPLLAAVTNFLVAVSELNADLVVEETELLLKICTDEYFHSISNLSAPFQHWFAMPEVCFILDVISLLKLRGCRKKSVCLDHSVKENWVYHTALTLLLSVRSPFEWLLKRVFEEIIFNMFYFTERSEIEMEGICDFYFNFYASTSAQKRSWDLYQQNNSCITTYCFQQSEGLLPGISWSYAPIVKYYQDSKTRKDSDTPAGLLSDVTCCLRWIWVASSNSRLTILRKVPIPVKFTYLCMVFLADPEIFKEENVSQLLSLLLQDVLSSNHKIDLVGMSWKLIPTFEEIFAELLVQYEAVSFGDQCFGNIITIPLQQCYPTNWRLMLFSDHEQILYFLNLPLDRLLVPMKNFLEPAETDHSLLKRYFQALSSGKLNYNRSPLLYLIAVHHLHHYIHDKTLNTEFQKTLQKSLQRHKKKEFYNHIMCYGGPNLTSKLGFIVQEKELNTDEAVTT